MPSTVDDNFFSPGKNGTRALRNRNQLFNPRAQLIRMYAKLGLLANTNITYMLTSKENKMKAKIMLMVPTMARVTMQATHHNTTALAS